MELPQPFTVYAPGLAGVPKDERYVARCGEAHRCQEAMLTSR